MRLLRADSVATREPLVRLFHGSLVMAFTTAYVGGEAEALDLHALAGWRSRRPLAGLLRGSSEPVGDALETVHEFSRPPRSYWSACTLPVSPWAVGCTGKTSYAPWLPDENVPDSGLLAN